MSLYYNISNLKSIMEIVNITFILNLNIFFFLLNIQLFLCNKAKINDWLRIRVNICRVSIIENNTDTSAIRFTETACATEFSVNTRLFAGKLRRNFKNDISINRLQSVHETFKQLLLTGAYEKSIMGWLTRTRAARA